MSKGLCRLLPNVRNYISMDCILLIISMLAEIMMSNHITQQNTILYWTLLSNLETRGCAFIQCCSGF